MPVREVVGRFLLIVTLFRPIPSGSVVNLLRRWRVMVDTNSSFSLGHTFQPLWLSLFHKKDIVCMSINKVRQAHEKSDNFEWLDVKRESEIGEFVIEASCSYSGSEEKYLRNNHLSQMMKGRRVSHQSLTNFATLRRLIGHRRRARR